MLKKHLQNTFIDRFSQKNWWYFQQSRLHCSKNWIFILKPSNAQVDGNIPCHSQKSNLHLLNISSCWKNTFGTLLHIMFHKRLTKLSHLYCSKTKSLFYNLVLLKLMAEFLVFLKNPLTLTQYFNFSICWKNTFRQLLHIEFMANLLVILKNTLILA